MANTWTLKFIGDLAASPPTITVRSNAAKPLKKVNPVTGVKTDGTVSFTPTATGGTITVDADEGGFDIVVVRADQSKFETNLSSGPWSYKGGIQVGALVDDVAAALAGPNPDVPMQTGGAQDLLRKKDDASADDTGIVVKGEPPPRRTMCKSKPTSSRSTSRGL